MPEEGIEATQVDAHFGKPVKDPQQSNYRAQETDYHMHALILMLLGRSAGTFYCLPSMSYSELVSISPQIARRFGCPAFNSTIPPVNIRIPAAVSWTVIAVTALVLMLFEVSIDPVFALPGETEIADPDQESAFNACVDDIRLRVLQEAYAETDNPEVHSTMIRIAESEAPVECRRRFPRRQITVATPFEFNLIDLEWRY